MNHYHNAMSELFKVAAMQQNLAATGILAKLLELTTEPAKALAYWNNNKHHLARMADTLTLQEVGEYLEKSQ